MTRTYIVVVVRNSIVIGDMAQAFSSTKKAQKYMREICKKLDVPYEPNEQSICYSSVDNGNAVSYLDLTVQ